MGFTSILAIVVIALLVIAVKIIIDGVKSRNWKKVIITGVVTCVCMALIWFGFISFITSM
ncbi:hypothetical protein HMPREF1986_01368 [Oribacterium sp. oral taxon 078 str. F0263]|jgi:hypothetical protein|uniref:hypothetical protein n=1 Tax=Oribacterium sp. oral taxon 078 TaxID=652706 RepID=UPI0003ADB699|nr:hypothetical protein [Oribacterium sp. oral taxon 078]ERL21454.1 hypothetical protein HMPREF1986_01368 [Oribacterium sp. oral taxon 078 str. F0263]